MFVAKYEELFCKVPTCHNELDDVISIANAGTCIVNGMHIIPKLILMFYQNDIWLSAKMGDMTIIHHVILRSMHFSKMVCC